MAGQGAGGQAMPAMRETWAGQMLRQPQERSAGTVAGTAGTTAEGGVDEAAAGDTGARAEGAGRRS